MKLFYGTTSVIAARVRRRGLRPAPALGATWCSRSLAVAQVRARHACRAGGGTPVVIVCHLNVRRFRHLWGRDALHARGPMVMVRGEIDVADIGDILPVPSATLSPVAVEGVLTGGEILRLLDSPSPRVRLMGVMMLSAQRSPEAFDWLCTCLDDPDARVRLAVAMALRRRGPEAGEVLRHLQRDDDPRVRQAAFTATEGAPVLVG